MRLQSNKQISTKRNNKMKIFLCNSNNRQRVKAAAPSMKDKNRARTLQNGYYLSQKALKASYHLASMAFF